MPIKQRIVLAHGAIEMDKHANLNGNKNLRHFVRDVYADKKSIFKKELQKN